MRTALSTVIIALLLIIFPLACQAIQSSSQALGHLLLETLPEKGGSAGINDAQVDSIHYWMDGPHDANAGSLTPNVAKPKDHGSTRHNPRAVALMFASGDPAYAAILNRARLHKIEDVAHNAATLDGYENNYRMHSAALELLKFVKSNHSLPPHLPAWVDESGPSTKPLAQEIVPSNSSLVKVKKAHHRVAIQQHFYPEEPSANGRQDWLWPAFNDEAFFTNIVDDGENVLIGMGNVATAATFGLGKQINYTISDIGKTGSDGENYESTLFQAFSQSVIDGKTETGMLKELSLNISGYRFGNQINDNWDYGLATGDFSRFSQNMGQFAFIAGTPKALAIADRIDLPLLKQFDPEDSLRPCPELRRPYIRVDVRAEVEARAPKTPEGDFIDLNTGETIKGKYHLGHKPGHEFHTEKAKAEAKGLNQKKFNNEQNNPDLYQIEHPSANQSHQFEHE
ncbi:MAG: hypothetical protein JWQ04_2382 [Pedosphaera sp.]|nr:hypothetical protein [Pedosphaera sp.]